MAEVYDQAQANEGVIIIETGTHITLEDAKQGLLKAIVYLQYLKENAQSHVHLEFERSLWNILNYIQTNNGDNMDTPQSVGTSSFDTDQQCVDINDGSATELYSFENNMEMQSDTTADAVVAAITQAHIADHMLSFDALPPAEGPSVEVYPEVIMEIDQAIASVCGVPVPVDSKPLIKNAKPKRTKKKNKVVKPVDSTPSIKVDKPKHTRNKDKVVKHQIDDDDFEDNENFEEVLSYSAGKEIPTRKVGKRIYPPSAPGTKRIYRCTVCNMVFHTRSNFRYHMYAHKGKYPFRCEVCNRGFTRPSTWYQHIKYHHKNERVSCNICNREFSSVGTLRRHKKESCTSDEVPQMFACKICGKQCRSRRRIDMHMRVHDDNRKKCCTECAASFADRYGLNAHMKLKHSKHGNKTQADLKRTCRQCGDEFRSPFLLKRHVDAVHLMIQHKCSLCDMIFSCKKNLGRHMRYNCPKQTQKSILPCKVCGKPYNVPSSLAKHMKLCHKDNEVTTITYPCKWCDETYSKLSLLREHQKSDHPHADIEENGHPRADIKDKFPLHAENVQIHDHEYTGKELSFVPIKTENKESIMDEMSNRVTCDLCGMLLRKKGLRKHQKYSCKLQTQKCIVQCTICGRRLATTSGLRRHMDTHEANKCKKCEISFDKKYDLDAHNIKFHSGNNDSEEDGERLASGQLDSSEGLVMSAQSSHVRVFTSTSSLQTHDAQDDGENRKAADCGGELGDQTATGRVTVKRHYSFGVCKVYDSEGTLISEHQDLEHITSAVPDEKVVRSTHRGSMARSAGTKRDAPVIRNKRVYPKYSCRFVPKQNSGGEKWIISPQVNAKLYSCDVCGTSYALRSSLRKHQRLKHAKPTVKEGVSPTTLGKGMKSRRLEHGFTTVTVEPTVKPVSIKQDVTPGTVEQGVKSVPQEQVVTPVSREQGVTPVSQEQGVTPVSQEQGVTPVSQEQGVTPVSQEQGVTPVSQEQGVMPVSLNVDANESHACSFKFCDKAFKSKMALIGHSRQHVHQCEECGIHCSSKISVRSHLQHVHSSIQQ